MTWDECWVVVGWMLRHGVPEAAEVVRRMTAQADEEAKGSDALTSVFGVHMRWAAGPGWQVVAACLEHYTEARFDIELPTPLGGQWDAAGFLPHLPYGTVCSECRGRKCGRCQWTGMDLRGLVWDPVMGRWVLA